MHQDDLATTRIDRLAVTWYSYPLCQPNLRVMRGTLDLLILAHWPIRVGKRTWLGGSGT